MENAKVVVIQADADVLKKLGDALGVDLNAAIASATGQVVASEPVSEPVWATESEEIEEEDSFDEDEDGGCTCSECCGEEPKYRNESFGLLERHDSADDLTELVFNLENVDPDTISVKVEGDLLSMSAKGYGDESFLQEAQIEATDDRDGIYVEFDQDSERLTVVVDKLPAVEESRIVLINFV